MRRRLVGATHQHDRHVVGLGVSQPLASDDGFAVVAKLKACAKQKDLHTGRGIHAFILGTGLLAQDIYVGNTLIYMYVRCGALATAHEVFNDLPSRDTVSWNSLIAGYAQHGHGSEPLHLLQWMQLEGLSPDPVTFVCVLKACGRAGAGEKGRELHLEIVRQGLLEQSVLVGNALVDMYAKCRMLVNAQEVFDQLPNRNVVSWSALIDGYAQNGHSEEALRCYNSMQHIGITPDAVTFLPVLKACGTLGAVELGEEVHADIVNMGYFKRHNTVGTALMDMYIRCGALAKAQEVFDELPSRDGVSWSALIAGYAQYGHAEEALNCFELMQSYGFSPSVATIVGILKACGTVGMVGKGGEIHAEIDRKRILASNLLIGNALVDMYVKCGALTKAQEVFDQLRFLNVVTWNVLISGYAAFGEDDCVFDSFCKMTKEGIKPNLATLTHVLNACSQSGLLENGQVFFECMSRCHDINLSVEQHICMVDLYGRAGCFDSIIEVIRKMPCPNCSSLWSAILGACRNWENTKVGRLAFEHSIQLDQKDVAAYVGMKNIYAAAGLEDDAKKIEAMRLKNKAC